MTHPQIVRALRLMNMEKNGTPTVANFDALLTDQGRVDAFIELLQRPGALQQIFAYSNLTAALFNKGVVPLSALTGSAGGMRAILSDPALFANAFSIPSTKAQVLESTALAPASVPAMTSNTAPFGHASSSTYYNDNYGPWRAFDMDAGTHWQTTGAQPINMAWIAYKFQTPACVLGVTITQSMSGYRIQSADIQRSMDGVVFSTAASVTFLDIEDQSVEVNASGFYPHWRIKVNSDYGSGYCVVHGISFSGFLQ